MPELPPNTQEPHTPRDASQVNQDPSQYQQFSPQDPSHGQPFQAPTPFGQQQPTPTQYDFAGAPNQYAQNGQSFQQTTNQHGTQQFQQPNYSQGQQFPGHGQVPEKQKSTLGLIALITAIVGFIFACVPGALIVGWILLPIAFILALVSLFQKNKFKGKAIAALILSVLGTIVAIIVFFVVVVVSVDDALSGGDVTVTEPVDKADASAEADKDAAEKEEPQAAANSRSNPFPIGTTVATDDWEFTLNGVNLDATQLVLDENQFNDSPADGNTYILANVTLKYVGTDDEGSTPWATMEFVTVDGNSIASYDSFFVAPEELDTLQTMYEGATITGNLGLEVPAETASEGTLAVNVDMFGDTQFFAVK